MRALMLLALVTCAAPGASAAHANEETLARAQERFQQGADRLREVAESRRLFAAAAADLQELHRDGVRSPALYLALGNAEALAGRWPRAIWAYECGRQLDPNDATLREHLDYARTLINYPPGGRGQPAPDAWPSWLYRPSAGECLVCAAIAYSLAWLTGGWWWVRRRALPLALAVGLSALALAAGTGWYLVAQQLEYDREHLLVVIADANTPLYRGNGPSYPLNGDVPNLPAGLEARVLHERGAWLQVQLATGEIGWVMAEQVLIVSTR